MATSEGDLDKADRALASCFRIDNLNPFCGFQRIETLTYEGHADLAIAEYNRLTRGGSKYPWFDEPAGYAELSIGDVGASANHFNALAASRHTFASTVHFRASQDGLAAIDAYQGKRIDSETKLKTALETATSGYSRADYFLLMANINVLYGHVAEGKDALLNVAQLSHSGELAMSLAKTFAMAGDFVAARAVLREHKGGEAALGQSFPAAEQFVDGLEALQNRDLTTANAALGSSNRIDSSPETAYFLAQAEMQRNDWGEASGVLNGLLAQRGAIVIDGPAALIPLAVYDLSICYRKMGNESEASRHLATVAEIWNRADCDIKRLLAR